MLSTPLATFDIYFSELTNIYKHLFKGCSYEKCYPVFLIVKTQPIDLLGIITLIFQAFMVSRDLAFLAGFECRFKRQIPQPHGSDIPQFELGQLLRPFTL